MYVRAQYRCTAKWSFGRVHSCWKSSQQLQIVIVWTIPWYSVPHQMIFYSNWQYPQRAKGWVVNFWGLHTKSVGNKRFEFDFRFHILVCRSKFSMPYDQSPFHVWGLPSVLASPISWGQRGSSETPGLLDSIWIQTGPHWDILHIMDMRPVDSLTPKLFFIRVTFLCVVQPTHLVVYPWPWSNRPLITFCITRISASESWDSESTPLWDPILCWIIPFV